MVVAVCVGRKRGASGEGVTGFARKREAESERLKALGRSRWLWLLCAPEKKERGGGR